MSAASGPDAAYVLRRATVLDEAGCFAGPLDVSVAGGRIQAVGRELAAPDLPSLDLEGLFLMPGVFDCHAHVAISTVDTLELLRTPIAEWALAAGDNARRTLAGGVTFVRDAGGAEAGLRSAVEKGLATGPRLQLSVVMLSQTGGHGDGFLPGPGAEIVSGYMLPDYPGRPRYLVDGPETMRVVVREVLRAGADWVKLCATGGVMSPGDRPEEPELTVEEIAVAVHEAARRGRHVLAHAMGGEGLDNAVVAGVRSIEHGLFLTEAQARRMAEAGCWLVPTLTIVSDVMTWAEEGSLPPYAAEKALELRPRLGNAVAVARAAGVRIAVGTDSFTRGQHGRNLRELALLGEAGMPPAEVLLAATAGGAELCGVAGSHGRIAPGFVFDAILLDRDPSDLSVFAAGGAVTGVFKGGRAVVPHERLVAEGVPAPA